jgi:alginate biosynthesis protein Alg44
MAAVPNINVVHESEAQRQHVRVKLPASIQFAFNGTEHSYRLHDISAGGFSFDAGTARFTVGRLIHGTLLLTANTVGLSLPVDFEVSGPASAQSRVSCRFQDLSAEAIATLRQIITSYLAGELVSAGDVLATVARNNFVAARTVRRSGSLSMHSRIRALVGTGVAVVIGAAAFVYTLIRLYDIVVVTHAAAAKVAARTYTITMPRDGTFFSLLQQSGKVKKGQPLGSFQTGLLDIVAGIPGSFKMTPAELSGLMGQQLKGSIASPCDCVVQKLFVTDAQYVLRNQSVAELVPQNATPYVLARFHYDELRNLPLGRKVHFRLSGSDQDIQGTIAELRVLPAQTIDSNGLNDLNGLNTNAAITDVIAVIKPSVELSLSTIDEPVDVRVDPLSGWWH